MSSLNNISTNTRSMNGLSTINADNVNTNNLEVSTLIIDNSGIAPTMPASDNSQHIATTAFVTSHTSSNYVTLNTVQTITAEKTFLDNVNFTNGINGNYIYAASSIDTPAINSGLGTDNLNIVSGQTSGTLNIGCRTNRTGNINIGTLATGNAPIVIGSTASTTQTATHNAITTFNKIPSCSIAPTSGNNLVNKTYVDNEIAGGLTGYVDIASDQTITGEKTFAGYTIFDNNVLNNFTVTNNDNCYFNNQIECMGTATLRGIVNITGETAGNVNIGINTVSSNNIFFNFGYPTLSAQLKMHYISALNRISVNIPTTKQLAFGVNTNDYIILDHASTTTQVTSNLSVGGGLTMNSGANFTFIPIGTINTSVVATVPTGFLYCNGQAVNRSIYAGLFLAIGTTFGAGNGSTTFNVPNFQGAFIRGAGNQTVGDVTYTAPAVGTAQQDQVLQTTVYATNEGFRDCAAGARECVARYRITGDPVDTGTGILPQFQRQGTENRPMNYSVYYYIKF
jgi:hypothetical protein